METQVSFIIILVKGGQRKMLTVLQSLALIKGNFKKVRIELTWPSIRLTYEMKQTETQAETVEYPKAKATSIKWKAGYGHEQKSEHKKKRADDIVIEAETHR